jgi:hypothetical protein
MNNKPNQDQILRGWIASKCASAAGIIDATLHSASTFKGDEAFIEIESKDKLPLSIWIGTPDDNGVYPILADDGKGPVFAYTAGGGSRALRQALDVISAPLWAEDDAPLAA